MASGKGLVASVFHPLPFLSLLLSCWVVSNSSMTAWTVARQAPLSMGFPRQEYWSRLPCPPPGDLPNPGIKSASPALRADIFTAELLLFLKDQQTFHLRKPLRESSFEVSMELGVDRCSRKLWIYWGSTLIFVFLKNICSLEKLSW